MSEERPIYVVPIHPDAFGLAVAVGCLSKILPFIIVALLIASVIAVVFAGINQIAQWISVTQLSTRIEVESLVGGYDSSRKQFVVDYQLYNHSDQGTSASIGVQLPVKWFSCDRSSDDHDWTYGGSTDQGVPATARVFIAPNSRKSGSIGLNPWPGFPVSFYVQHCKYEIGQPQFQILGSN